MFWHLRKGTLVFQPKKILNKSILLDVSKVNGKQIMGKIIENLPTDNGKFYIAHEPGTNS